MEKIGRYQIVGELGRGAMGVVYRALDPNIGRTVALKTMRLDTTGMPQAEMVRRFRSEARAAGLMNHPNIVTIHDADESNGLFYIAMEYLEGDTLQSLLAKRQILAAQEIVQIGKQVAAGLDYAHAMKVVHRDIKPPNIMITRQNVAKIMDFGIAKSDGGMTRSGQIFGTPFYMSPEQVSGGAVDGRSDLFSLGAMLYEVATGARPFEGDLTAVLYKIVNENPLPPCDRQIGLHPGLAAVITRCLAKKPDERCQTGAQLAADLENYHSLEPADQEATTVLPKAARTTSTTTTRTVAAVPTMALSPAAGSRVTDRSQLQGRRSSKAARVAMAAIFVLASGAGLVSFAKLYMTSPQPGSGSLVNASAPASSPASHVTPVAGEGSKSLSTKAMTDTAQTPLRPRVVETSANHSSFGNHVDLKPEMNALSVSSNPPGAKIEIDSSDTGRTTPSQIPVTEGQHTVVLRLPGYQPASGTALVAKGRTVDFQQKLAPVVASASGSPNVSPLPAVPNDKALIDFVTVPPGASIFIEGHRANMATPAHNLFPPGDYTVELKMEGYKPVQRIVHVDAGQVAKVEAVLAPL